MTDYRWKETLPTLAGPRVRLRWLEDEDTPALLRMFSDPEVLRYWGSPALGAIADAEDLLRRIRDHFGKRTLFQWGIARTRDDVVIGTATLHRFDVAHRRAEV